MTVTAALAPDRIVEYLATRSAPVTVYGIVIGLGQPTTKYALAEANSNLHRLLEQGLVVRHPGYRYYEWEMAS